MSYLSLYRKYRSQSFEELFGQEHVTRTLQNALRAGRVGHAYLFSGPRGTGKTSSARLLARALNCERGPTPTPCGECVACHEIRDGISPSVVEIDAASSRGIDEVRDLRQRVMTVPSQPGARKVFIVDEVHMLTTEACNALLKTLEEPPAHVLFILATTDAQKLPATILSRCQRFEFRRGSVSLIGERLKYVAEAEGYTLEPEAVRLMARASGGSWRDAISLLEQALSFGDTTVTAAGVAAVLGAVGEESLLALTDGLTDADGRVVYPIVGQLIDEGTEPRQLARDLGEHFRALLMADAGALALDSYSPETARRMGEQAARLGTTRLVAALESLAHAEKEMRWSDSGRVVLEVALARLMLAPSVAAPAAVAATNGIAAPAAGSRVAEGRAPSPLGSPAPPATRGPAARLAPTPPPDTARPPAPVSPDPSRGESPKPASPVVFDPFEHEDLPAGIAGARPPGEPERSTPAVSPASPAAPPGMMAPAALTLEQLKGRWPVVIEELKRSRTAATTAALLAEAQPVGCEGQILMLGFRYGTLRDKWDRGDHKQRLQEAMNSVFGQSLPVRTTTLGEPTPSMNSSPAPPESSASRNGGLPAGEASEPLPLKARPNGGSSTAPPDLLQGDALLHEVVSQFEGQIVEPETR